MDGLSGSPCGNCCECFRPVRCVIDQHEVEIVPASDHTGSSSSCFTSSRCSTSRSGFGSNTYRHMQMQQLSQRAALANGTECRNTSLQEIHEQVSQELLYSQRSHQALSSFRSASSIEIFAGSPSAVDVSVPKVPPINLRSIQGHSAPPPDIAFSERGSKRNVSPALSISGASELGPGPTAVTSDKVWISKKHFLKRLCMLGLRNGWVDAKLRNLDRTGYVE